MAPEGVIKASLLEGEDCINKLAENISHNEDSPFTITDLRDIRYKMLLWQQFLPSVEPFFAIKANSDEEVLKTLTEMGSKFSVASKKDLEIAQNLNIDPNKIVFSNPCKPNSQIKTAAKNGIQILTFDSENELRKIQKSHPTASLLLRISVDNLESDSFAPSSGALDIDWLSLLESAKNNNMNVVGISFDLGDSIDDIKMIEIAISKARAAANILMTLGFEMKFLDLGGGFPHFGSLSGPIFEDIVTVVHSALAFHFQQRDFENVRFIANPSKFLVGSAVTVATRVCDLEETESGKIKLFVNDNQTNVFENASIDGEIPDPSTISAIGELSKCSIFVESHLGDLCLKDLALLPSPEIGMLLLWFNMGFKFGTLNRINNYYIR